MTRLLIFLLLGFLLSGVIWQSYAADNKREWVILTNCQYVAGKSNDGDSFRVRCGTNEFVVYYVLVEAGGKSLAEALVSQGLARTKGIALGLPTGEKSKAYLGKLEALEREAREKRLGVWANSVEKEP